MPGGRGDRRKIEIETLVARNPYSPFSSSLRLRSLQFSAVIIGGIGDLDGYRRPSVFDFLIGVEVAVRLSHIFVVRNFRNSVVVSPELGCLQRIQSAISQPRLVQHLLVC